MIIPEINSRPNPISLRFNELNEIYKPELEIFACEVKAHPRYKTIQKILDKIEKAEKSKGVVIGNIDPVSALTGTYHPKNYLGYEYIVYDCPFSSPGKRRSRRVKAVTEKDVDVFISTVSLINKKLGFESKPSVWDIAIKFSQNYRSY